MRFLILGPLEVRGDDGVIALGGVKPRAVLTVLLLNANEAVSAERLALALWGEDAPAGATKTVQVHVSRLRKALGAGDLIDTSPSGYRLRVRPGELDAEQFSRLVGEGRHALADGRHEEAATTLAEALTMWRGPALAELAFEPFARGEVARLEEQRLAALEARVAADLALGRHAELVAELQQLVATNQTREQLAAHLMLALYRCGRQSDALAAFQETRRVLIDEIGVEPGLRLRELQDAILRQDPMLERDEGPPELPPELDASTSAPLVGRADELAWLRLRWERAREGVGALVVLAGEHGSGKSRLAAELAGDAHRRGDAVLYVGNSRPTPAALRVLKDLEPLRRPTLVVVDEPSGELLAAFASRPPSLAQAPLLILACCEDATAIDWLAADVVLTLEPLGEEAVCAIARQYASDAAREDVPADWLLEASGGIPRRVHEVASQWARREVARRVTLVAGRAETERAQLRVSQDELVGSVVALQEASERTRPRPAGETHMICPFKGLASYEVEDADYFFGRERLVAELVACLVGAPLFAVVGPSGSGKSSVMRAGLLPALAAGVLPGSESWSQVLVRPGAQPARELSGAMSACHGHGGRVVLAVDQFEETFTVCTDESERSAFVAELVRMARDPGASYVVILALRADCYGRCAAYPELSALLSANNVLVRPMQHEELRHAVEGPSRRAGLRVEPDLVKALVADVEREPGGLPLLSTALLELWQRRDGSRLRYGTYVESGGVRGAVARLAEDAFGQLDVTQHTVARAVLMRLVDAGIGDDFERRRVALEELEIDRHADVAEVVALLTDRRLLTVSEGAVEIAHEALLREWPRLRGWIEEDRDGLRIQRALSTAAEEWERLGRDEGALYRGTRLREAVEWRTLRVPALNELERAYLAAGEAAQGHERTTRRRRVALVLGAVTMVLLAGTGAVLAAVFASRQNAITASRDLATKSASVVRFDPGIALVIAREALQRHGTEQAENALRQATFADRSVSITQAHKGIAFDIAFSRDGRLLATSGEDGLVRIWRPDGRPVSTIKGHKAPALAAAFSPDGKQVATVGVDGEIAIANVDGGRRRVLLRLSGGEFARSVEFSPDGKRLLVGTASGVVGFVPLSGAARLEPLGKHGDRVKASFDADGTKVVSASGDGSARIWDVAGHAQPIRLEHGVEVNAAAFSPDGSRVATAGADGALRVWDARSGGLLRTISVDGQALLSVDFNADGRRLATGGEDGVVRLSDMAGGPPVAGLRGHAGSVYVAAFVPAGRRTVVSAGEDGTLRLWAPPVVASLPIAGGVKHAPTGPSFSPDGRHVVSGAVDGAVRVWNPASGAVSALPRLVGFGSHAAYSADGSHIVSAGGDGAGSVKLWDVERRRSRNVPSPPGEKYAVAIDTSARRVAIATLDQPTIIEDPDGRRRSTLRGHTSVVSALAFSPDGKHVASASADGTSRIWAATNGAQERLMRQGKAVSDIAYSGDGRYIATAGTDGTVRIWPVGPGAPILLYGHDGAVSTVAFDHTGRLVVSAGADGTVRIWSASGGEALVVLQTHIRRASGAAFSPDGTRVVSAGDEGVLRTTSCDVCGTRVDVLRLAGSRAHRTLDESQRRQLLSKSG